MLFLSYWHTAVYGLILWIVLVKTVGTHTLPNLGLITMIPLLFPIFILDLNIDIGTHFLLKPVPYFVISLPYVLIFYRIDFRQTAKAVFISEGIMLAFKLLFALSCAL